VIEEAAQEWRHGKPANADRDLAQERMRLTEEITLTYSDRPAARDVMAEDIDQALAGLPAGVTLGVLTDWHADLLARDPDPDPETDIATPLDLRIARQLQRAGVPRTRLSAEWRERLDEVERR